MELLSRHSALFAFKFSDHVSVSVRYVMLYIESRKVYSLFRMENDRSLFLWYEIDAVVLPPYCHRLVVSREGQGFDRTGIDTQTCQIIQQYIRPS